MLCVCSSSSSFCRAASDHRRWRGGEEEEGGAGALHESVSDRGDKWRSGRGRGKGEEIES